MSALRNLRCLVGHDFDGTYRQPDPPFERRWNGALNEAMWYEMFDHKCRRCGKVWRHWRWTRAAMARQAQEQP